MSLEKIKANRNADYEINAHEAEYYHVLHTKKVHYPAEQRYEDKLMVQLYRPMSWDLLKGKISKGSDKVEIIHDPTYKPVAKKKPAVKKEEK